MKLKFEQPKMSNGESHPSWWHSECGTFMIAKYTFDATLGYCVDEYYNGYRRSDGRRLNDIRDHLSFDQVVATLQDYSDKQ